MAVVRVRDNGIGIAPEILPQIFDLFAQADRSLDRSRGGVGIGLTLVRSLVQMHGGRIDAFSDGPAKGSEFVVRLPALPAGTTPRIRGTQALRQAPRALTMLVVDDNVDTATSLAMLLRLHGHRVEVAHDGPAALEAARAQAPEVILLDVGLPGMDGYQVAEQLRASQCARRPILVAVTGRGHESNRQRSKEAGFDYHLVKPVDPEKLEELLASLASSKTKPGPDSGAAGVAPDARQASRSSAGAWSYQSPRPDRIHPTSS